MQLDLTCSRLRRVFGFTKEIKDTSRKQSELEDSNLNVSKIANESAGKLLPSEKRNGKVQVDDSND